MTDYPLVHEQTPTDDFNELVESSLSRQHVRAGDLTEVYLVNLLCQNVRVDASPNHVDDEQPLGLRLLRALESGECEQRVRLRGVGDWSLFMSGFFSDRFTLGARSTSTTTAGLGERAYASLSQSEDEAFAEVFGELSRKFVGFMDVLADISDRTGSGVGDRQVMRLYEKWLRTGGERDGQRLVERGILPNQSIGRRFIQ